MAHIKINVDEFRELAGGEISDEQLRDQASFLGAHWTHVEDDKWDVEAYPNRPDLLSVEGLARAYRGFFGIETGPENYSVREGEIELEVDDSVEEVRPHIGGAVIRGIELDERVINGLIQMQEKLHETMGRKRDKLAIGLHDLSELEPPFTYDAVEPEKVSFTPLEKTEEMHLEEILESHEKGQEYSWILEDHERYPVIIDSEDQVLSFPPIINNQLTEVHEDTDDIFIDVTGKDRETVLKALNILVTAFAERGAEIESVEVDGEELPDLEPEVEELDPDYLRSISGLELSEEEIVERLEKMKHGAEKDGDVVRVEVPAYRTDVMHQYDLIEDVVIAHGYDNIEPELPEIDQIAEEKPVEDFESILRDIFAGSGALEAHTYVLSSREKLFDLMERDGEEIAEMANALTEDYSVVRNWMLPSMLEILKRNRQHSYPQSFFEVADVVLRDDSPTGASNRRKAAYVKSGHEVDYTDVRGLLQVLERDLGVEFEVRQAENSSFREKRYAEIHVDGEKVGFMGEIADEVRENWKLDYGVVAMELDVEKLMEYR
ncbi:MAG: phenylalanine--tRNA ligase subunit beta [Candidatus Nanohaloarchaea archaeon]